jgi:hypothetical protein
MRELFRGISAPPEANRIRGPQFKNWLRKQFEFVGIDHFRNRESGIVFLEANERITRDFCNQQLNMGLTKRPDFLAKVNARYIVGEAKFLTSIGGEQSAGFSDGINLLQRRGKGIKVFVLDGVVWVAPTSREYHEIEETTYYILSALLLRDFLESNL